MKQYLLGIYYSLPVQLLFLHFRRFQVLLIFWYIQFGTVNGSFLKAYGANSLYLAPEYLGKVNWISAGMIGFAIGIFIMSWNITTFILHSRHIKFLATTSNPFLKYCINNGIIPVVFLVFYLIRAVQFNRYQQLMSYSEITIIVLGFIAGLVVSISIAFLYFFGADRTIYRRVASIIQSANMRYALATKDRPLPPGKSELRVDWFLNAQLAPRKPRDVRHYSQDFLDTIFKRHHLAAVFSILIAFIFLLVLGFFLDNPIFQIPAGASSTIIIAILIAVAGAFSLFLGTWSLPALILLIFVADWMYEQNFIDTKSKAYGINYSENQRPEYTQGNINNIAETENEKKDKLAFLQILNAWKAKQKTDKPVIYFINVSGGGNRSATFTMSVLQHLDSITNGQLLNQTFLINGASGGMLGATYFRELFLRRQQGEKLNLSDNEYLDNISKDLLNPLFSSFVAREITAPSQRFYVGEYSYVKDRGYSFEQKLNENTYGVLNKQLGDYIEDERNAVIPMMFFNSFIIRDGRKLLISTHPARFMMKADFDSSRADIPDPDMIDFVSLFKRQSPHNLRLLTAMRMSATFPYVLPNVWLPTKPEIEVMDGGLRDNFGLETTIRFIDKFKDWLNDNTSGVILIQIRDRKMARWDAELEKPGIINWLVNPIILIQDNLFKLQDYYFNSQLSYTSSGKDSKIERVLFQYIPSKNDASASLSFHLTNAEKEDITAALKDSLNQKSFNKIKALNRGFNLKIPAQE